MIKLNRIAVMLAAAVFLSACGNSANEGEEIESITYNYDKIKELYNNEISTYYNSIEDYKKNKAEFLYFDIDGNNIPELILSTWEGGYDVYTVDNESVYKCGSVYAPLYKSPENTLVSIENFGNSYEGCREYGIEDNTIKSQVIFSLNPDGTENVPQTEKEEIPKSYNTLKSEYSENKLTGISVSENIDKLDELFPEMSGA